MTKISKILGEDKDDSTAYQNLWDLAYTVLRGSFIDINAYIKKTEIIFSKKFINTSQRCNQAELSNYDI